LSFFSNLVVTKDNYFLIVKPQYAKGYYNNYISAFEIAKKAYNAQDWLSEVKKVNESDKKGYIAEKFYVREGELRNAMAESAKDFIFSVEGPKSIIVDTQGSVSLGTGAFVGKRYYDDENQIRNIKILQKAHLWKQRLENKTTTATTE
jgi:hypothetical protein